ncbi:DUF3408 domain-containing protein [Bacteroides sp. UBA939]|uniref:DUF3408 domain-containing protein n=1 Tax=Bacteroides sp. UBA939 TaxID=1946092 RepID=UPI0025BE2B73|nr:DUF3408 domain-containing protein [Bacteroides sp. UBA939]
MAKRSDGIVKVDDIDEKEFLSILDGRATPTALPSKDKKEKPETSVSETEEPEKVVFEEKDSTPKRSYKKKRNSEYIDAFLKPRVLKQRQSVYISQDVHDFIAKIVKKLGVRNMTVGVFIDTVMTQHITEHADELRAIYYREEADIFKNILNNSEDDGNF